MQIIFIRHGMTAGNEEKRYIGRTDEPLSSRGREAVLRLRESGRLPKAGVIITSPMKRCIETAEILYPDKEIIQNELFREIDFGDYEGHNAAELLADQNSGYQAWIDSGGTMTFPHGESRDHFIHRCREGFAEMMKNTRKTEAKPNMIAVIAHGGTIMSILSGLCGGDFYDYMCGPAEGYMVTIHEAPAPGQGLEGWLCDRCEKFSSEAGVS